MNDHEEINEALSYLLNNLILEINLPIGDNQGEIINKYKEEINELISEGADIELAYASSDFDPSFTEVFEFYVGLGINVNYALYATLEWVNSSTTNRTVIRSIYNPKNEEEFCYYENKYVENFVNTIRMLINAGADIFYKQEKTILEMAKESRYPQIRNAINMIMREPLEREEAFYLSMLESLKLPYDKSVPLSGVSNELLNANPYLLRDIAGYVFGEKEKGAEESKSGGAEESKSGDAGGRRKSFRRKKSGSRRRKSNRRKKSGSKKRKSTRRKKSGSKKRKSNRRKKSGSKKRKSNRRKKSN